MMWVTKALWWTLEAQVFVAKDHRHVLHTCAKAGSLSARIVSKWAPFMCFPQWVVALTLAFKHPEASAIFGARFLAMCIVRKLDEHIPCTRALGLCHLSTFGPVYAWLWPSFPDASNMSTFGLLEWFLLSQKYVIGICLAMDARDLIFHLAGYPYPCYIWKGVRSGLLKLGKEDPRAYLPVTWGAFFIGP